MSSKDIKSDIIIHCNKLTYDQQTSIQTKLQKYKEAVIKEYIQSMPIAKPIPLGQPITVVGDCHIHLSPKTSILIEETKDVQTQSTM